MHLQIRKSYEPPTLRKPTWNQATLFLTGHAYIGDPGAKDLLELLFPMPFNPIRPKPLRDTREGSEYGT